MLVYSNNLKLLQFLYFASLFPEILFTTLCRFNNFTVMFVLLFWPKHQAIKIEYLHFLNNNNISKILLQI